MANAVKKNAEFKFTSSYKLFLSDLKERVRSAQIKAALSVNQELIAIYWELGESIVDQQEQYEWGSDFINQLSSDLSKEFPDMKGLSRRNLYRIKQWYSFFSNQSQIVPQAVAQFQEGYKTSQKPIVQQLVEHIPLKKCSSLLHKSPRGIIY